MWCIGIDPGLGARGAVQGSAQPLTGLVTLGKCFNFLNLCSFICQVGMLAVAHKILEIMDVKLFINFKVNIVIPINNVFGR